MKRALLFASILLAAAPAWTQQAQPAPPDTQSGNFLFRAPTGWTPVQKGDTLLLMAPALGPGQVAFIALSASDLDGDLRHSFDELWGGMQQSYRILQGGQITATRSTEGQDAFYTAALVADPKGTQWTVFVLGAQYRKRIQIVTFMSNLPPGSSMLNACENAFQVFLGNLTFGDGLPGSKVPPNSGPPDAGSGSSGNVPEDKPHALPPGMLEGIYVGYSGSSYNGRIGLRRLNFNPDGWVVKDVPQEGMVDFDFTAYRNAPDTNRSWVGRYRVEGNQINIVWQDYTDDREVIRRNETSAKPGINLYVPMCRCTGRHFAGKYLWGLAGSGQYLEFFPDGTFVDHGVTDQMLVPSPFYEHPRTQRGTYVIEKQTIIFHFADGHSGMRTFLAPKAQEKAGSFDFIGLGWQVLYEEHYQAEP